MKNQGIKKKIAIATTIAITIIVACITFIPAFMNQKTNNIMNAEDLRAKNYEELKDEDYKTDSDYVRFAAFFLRDTDEDGNANSLKGTCKNVLETDTLYMDISVNSKGHLKEGATIAINGDNFNFKTAIVTDSVVDGNYISDDTKTIKLKKIQNGTQKLMYGEITSNLNNNISKYCSDANTVTFEGTYVDDNGQETEINKTVNLTVDWYGAVGAEIPYSYAGGKMNSTQKNAFEDIVTTDEEAILTFKIATQETNNELLLKENCLEGQIPQLNGIKAKNVTVDGTNVTYTWDEENQKFTAKREAVLNENTIKTNANSGKYYEKRYNEYTVTVTYPIEAYRLIVGDTVNLIIPVSTYYVGYTNNNKEFNEDGQGAGLTKSNVATGTIALNYSVVTGDVYNFYVGIGKYVYTHNGSTGAGRYVVSKEKAIQVYNKLEEIEGKDYYTVRWTAVRGDGDVDKIVMKESDENYGDKFLTTAGEKEDMVDKANVKNVGIYFTDASAMLKDDGYINVYDDESQNLLHQFTKSDWYQYGEDEPYYFETPVKHIRVETSATNQHASLNVYSIKEIDDIALAENVERPDFDDYSNVYTYLKGMVYNEERELGTLERNDFASYEDKSSAFSVTTSKDTLSTQEIAKNYQIKIRTITNEYNRANWKNAIFLVKLPEDVISVNVNSVQTDNSSVEVAGYDVYEEDGSYYIKILTENENESSYNITIDSDITIDPLVVTKEDTIKAYAYNEAYENYEVNEQDGYDINANQNKVEYIGCASTKLQLISPSTLITSQTVTGYNSDMENEETIAPNVADITKTQRTATINVKLTNNYSSTISNTKIVGKVPYKENTYVTNNEELGSKFTATMTQDGIKVPETLQDYVTVYYSTKSNPSQNLQDEDNNWKILGEVENIGDIKTYLIDFGEYRIPVNESHNFTYIVNVPGGLNYNEVAYGVHAVYFGLDTDEGTYQTKTETNKVGIRIARKYKMELTKYRKSSEDVKVPGAFYTIEGKDEEGKVVSTRTMSTDVGGNINLDGLYVGLTYLIKEVKSPINYELNEGELEFKVIENGEGKLSVETTSGNISFDENEERVKIKTEDETKFNLEITKKDGIGNVLKGVTYKLTGDSIDTTKTTTSEGKITIRRLQVGKRYKLEELKADGYYVNEPIEFSVTREDNGELKTDLSGATIDQSGENVVIRTTQVNNKIPRYNLNILKVSKNDTENRGLKGARYKLTSDDTHEVKIGETNENGTIVFEDLYQYVEGKDFSGKYVLEEIQAPEGYLTSEEKITFAVKEKEGNLTIEVENGEESTSIRKTSSEGNDIQIILEDTPLFTLTKVDDYNGAPIEGAKFEIYKTEFDSKVRNPAADLDGNLIGELGSNGKHVVTTDSEGKITLALPAGFYEAVEVEAPEGCILPVNESERTTAFVVNGYEGTLRINYIEDLLDLSNYVNAGSTFEGVKIELAKTLDFDSAGSYRNSTDTTTYGDYNKDGTTQGIMEELKNEKGIGFRPIGSSETKYFGGIFDGKEYEINNLYINSSDDYIGLFGYVENAKIKNLSISGKINEQQEGGASTIDVSVGGICAYAKDSVIRKCTNKVNIKSNNTVSTMDYVYSVGIGGILGESENSEISYCSNYGKLDNTAEKNCEEFVMLYISMGGILARDNSQKYLNQITNISYCANYGDITCNGETILEGKVDYNVRIAGIGSGNSVKNCFNMGKINQKATNFSRFIPNISGIASANNISNSYNTGDIEVIAKVGEVRGNISGITGTTNPQLINCFNSGNIKYEYTDSNNKPSGGAWASAGGQEGNIKNCFNIGQVTIKNNVSGNLKIDAIYSGDYNKQNDSYPTNIENCYYLKGTKTTDSHGEEKEETYMKSEKFIELLNNNKDLLQEEYGDFDLLEWISQKDNSYPTLDIDFSMDNTIEDEETVIFPETEVTVENALQEFSITTEVKQNSEGKRIGGKITGITNEKYPRENNIMFVEDVKYNKSNAHAINIIPDTDYFIDAIWVDGEKIDFTVDKNRSFTLPPRYFKNVKKDIHVTVRFEKSRNFVVTENTNLTINKKDEKTDRPIPQTKFIIYCTTPEYEITDFAKYKNGEYIGEKDSDGRYIVKTDENGQIKLELQAGYYKVVEVEAAEDYVLEEKESLTTQTFKMENGSSDYKINYIEDLLKISDLASKGETFEGKTIDLLTTIDFNDDKSYKDPNDTTYQDYNGDGNVEGIKAELTNTSGCGFKPIGTSTTYFNGTFNGNGHEIKNIYQKTNFAGLFINISSAKIFNLGIVGGSITGSAPTGGIIGYQAEDSTISNCYNTADITSSAPAGGLVGYTIENVTINNCYNQGKVTSTNSYAGGLVGGEAKNSTINNCYNTADITGTYCAGGLIANSVTDNSNIYNCYNKGNVNAGNAPAGGIIADSLENSNMSNCYNTADITSAKSLAGGLIGSSVNDKSDIYNCYNKGNVNAGSAPAGGLVGNNVSSYSKISNFYNTGEMTSNISLECGIAYSVSGTMSNLYYLDASANEGIYKKNNEEGIVESKTMAEMKSNDFVNLLNNNKDKTESDIELSDWIFNKDDYPTLTENKVDNFDEYIEQHIQPKEFTMTNRKRNKKVIIEKVDKETNTPIPNTKFAIYNITNTGETIDFAIDVNGKYVGSKNADGIYEIATDENGQIVLSLPLGCYKAVEMEAAEGYVLEENEELRTTYFRADGVMRSADRVINCIEDLVDFANEVSNGKTFEGQIVELGRTLDFNDPNSYNNPDGTKYGNYNGDGKTEGIKAELTNPDGCGFKPIGTTNTYFKGTFNGNNHEIRNIYQNFKDSSTFGGLFSNISSAKILNLGIVGGSITSNIPGASLVGYQVGDSVIMNCYNSATICASPVGGLLGYQVNNSKIINCYNAGDVSRTYAIAGGIAQNITDCMLINCYNIGSIGETDCTASGGLAVGIRNSILKNCYNIGKVEAANPAGGIAQNITNSILKNCYNRGEIIGNSAGGLAASISETDVMNCYNTGNITSNYNTAGGLANVLTNGKINNCYNTGIITSSRGTGEIAYSSSSTMSNLYYLETIGTNGIYNKDDVSGSIESKTKETMQSQDFVDMLNNNKNSIDITLSGWNFEENSYPTLQKAESQIDFVEDEKVTITNNKIKDNLIIKKVDKYTREKLAGARFTLVDASDKNHPNLIGQMEKNPSSSYTFEKNGTQYYSSNYKLNGTVANAYFPIDLRNYTGTYRLSIDYTIGSESKYDVGYATITTSTAIPDCERDDDNNNTNNRFIYDSGARHDGTSSINLTGGKKYYLHIGYKKDGSVSNDPDRFYINSINLKFVSQNIQTNEDGIASTLLPSGKYTITETTAPTGYVLNSDPQTIEITSLGKEHEVVFENVRKESKYDKYNFVLTKKDKDTQETLEGVKFIVLDEQGESAKDYTGKVIGQKEEIDGQEQYVVTTDENGQIKLMLKPGKYKIVELETIEGYVLDGEQEFEIKDENITYEISCESEYVSTSYPYKDYIRVTSDGGMIQTNSGISKVIPAENTVDNQEINVVSGNGYVVKYNNEGKIENLIQIKGLSYGTEVYEDSDGNYIILGAGKKIEIPESDTRDGNAITLDYSSSSDRTIILKLDSDLKVIWAKKIDNCYPYGSMKYYIGEDKEGNYILGFYVNNSGNLTIPGDDTENNQQISLSNTISGPPTLLVKYTRDGMIRNANKIMSNSILSLQEKVDGGYVINDYGYRGTFVLGKDMQEKKSFVNNINGINVSTGTNRYITQDEGFIAMGTVKSNTTISGEYTADNQEIQINAKDFPINVLMKFNSDFKIEWVKEMSSESISQIKQDSDGNYVVLISESNYIAIEKYDSEGNTIDRMQLPSANSYMYTNNGNTQFILQRGNLTSYKFKENTPLEVTVTNSKKGKVTVHHYLEGTGPENDAEAVPLADDVVLEGKVNTEYTTEPNMNIENYTLIKDQKGDYVVPENASGTYTEEDQDVYYYYTRKSLELVVHHYLEETEEKLAEDEHYYYEENEHYQTKPSDEVLESYELVEVVGKESNEDDENGITKNEEVTYYYRIKKHQITTKVEVPEGQEEKGGNISGEGKKPYETVDHGKTSTQDIVIKSDKNYRIKVIKLVSTDEEDNSKETVIYDGRKVSEDAEVKCRSNEDGSMTLDKFENMTEDKEVIVVFEPDEGKVIVHHYVENSTERIHEDQIVVDLVGTEIETGPVKKENYVLVEEPADRTATITEQTQEKTYYYQREFNITTKVLEHTEEYVNGEIKEHIKGGSISGDSKNSYEKVLKGRDNKSSIVIQPSEGYEIVNITLSDGIGATKKSLDYSKLIVNGVVTIPVGYFENMQSDKHIEVEFRKKSNVIVKYFEKTEDGEYKELSPQDEITGYETKEYTTSRKDILYYRPAEGPDGKVEPENATGTMKADTIEVDYYYEKIPAGITVKHLEKITKPDGTVEGIEIAGVKDEHINGYAGQQYKTSRETIENYVPAVPPELDSEIKDVIYVGEDKNSYDGNYTEGTIIVVYWYERQFHITTKVKPHTEKTGDGEQGQPETVRGGTISGDSTVEETLNIPYEDVLRAEANKKAIDIIPDDGYRAKEVVINGKVVDVSEFEKEDHTIILPEGYFSDVQEDICVEVEFERIPAPLTVEYVDKDTGEKVAHTEITEHYVNDEYTTERKQVENYIPAGDEPDNASGKIVEGGVVVTYYYTRQFRITTDIVEHYESTNNDVIDVGVENGENKDETVDEKILVKGGKISGEDELPYEIVNRGLNNTKEIIITPDQGYRVKYVKIEEAGNVLNELSLDDLMKNGLTRADGTVVLPVDYFTNMQSDKHIKVEFEKIPAEITVDYLDKDTQEKVVESETATGYVNDEYKTHEKDIPYYELVKDNYPENAEGRLQEKTQVTYLYRRLLFNMKLTKELSSVQVNGNDMNIKNNKFVKIDLSNKEVQNTNILVKYKITVTNTEEIAGVAKILESIPEGLKLSGQMNIIRVEDVTGEQVDTWILSGNDLELITRELQPGETAEYEVILEWDTSNAVLGSLENVAKIIETQNVPQFAETTQDDNEDSCTVLISVKTGANEYIITISCLVLVGICTVAYIGKKIYNRRKNK